MLTLLLAPEAKLKLVSERAEIEHAMDSQRTSQKHPHRHLFVRMRIGAPETPAMSRKGPDVTVQRQAHVTCVLDETLRLSRDYER